MDPEEKKQNLSHPQKLQIRWILRRRNKRLAHQKSQVRWIQRRRRNKKVSKSQVIITSPSLSKEELREAMKKQNDVAMTLTGKVIASEARNSNLVFSPASINAVFTMAAASLVSISEELKAVFSEIATVVFTDGSANGGPKIAAINGVWVEQSIPVDPSFKDLLVNFFKSTFTQVDFIYKAEQVRRELNKWGSDHTNGLIRDLSPHGSIKNDTIIIYGNALYFKGAWKTPFDKSRTEENDFHLLNGEPVRVPFMRSYGRQYITAYDGFKVLRLPYRQGDNDDDREFSMCFFLPDKKDGLENLIEEMTSTPGFVDSHVPRCKVAVGDLRIPKFKISFMFQASKYFDELEVFLYHKACVEINEEGAEAAAVTIIEGRRGSRYSTPVTKIDFVADHPFLFLIREYSPKLEL